MESKSRSILFLFFCFVFAFEFKLSEEQLNLKEYAMTKNSASWKISFVIFVCFRFGLVWFFLCLFVFFLVLRRIIKTWSILQTFRSFSARFFFKLSKWRVTLLPVFWCVYVNDTHDQCGSKSEYVTWKQYALITKYRRYEAASLIQNRFATLN